MCASAVDTPANVLESDSFCKPTVNFYKQNKENPSRTKYSLCVSAGLEDLRSFRDAPCKLAWDKTFRSAKRQKGSYTPTHPRVKRTVTKAFALLTSAAAAASADDECRNFGSSIANKLRNYLLPTRNKAQHKMSHNIFAPTRNFLMFHILSPLRHQQSQVSSPTISSSTAGSEDVIPSDPACP